MNIGVSLYPDLMSKDDLVTKLETLNKHGVDLIFTSIQLEDLNFEGSDYSWESFLYLFSYAKNNNIKVSVDISKDSAHKLKINDINDLSEVSELGIFSLRIDGGYTYKEIAAFTKNKFNIKIEINASMTRELEELIKVIKEYGDVKNLIACHNFFPRENTGLGWKRFDNFNKVLRKHEIKIGAFITSQYSKSELCATSKGVPTIESHRGISVKYQIEDFKLRDIDYVIISESRYTNEELDTLKESVKNNKIIVYVEKTIKEIENKVFTFRPDQPEWIRRTEERIGNIEPKNNDVFIPKYSLTIDNVLNGRYSGEVQITLKDFNNADYVNLIGKVNKNQENLVSNNLLINKNIVFKEDK